jgi:alpha-beta hydrolase superfamily lysophospholipase
MLPRFPAARAAALLAGGAMMLLAGCATALPTRKVPLPPATAAQHAADRRLVPADLFFTLSDGAVLPARLWRAEGQERAVILALHGFNDSRDAWELPAPVLAAHGITVYAPDQRGFGEAPMRGHWAGTDRMISDAAELARLVARHEPGVPLFLMGESMGGAILMCLAARPDAPPVAGTILLAPAVWSRDQMNPAMTLSLWAAATLLPDWQLTGRELPLRIVATDNRAALYRLAYDPLTLRATRTATLRGLVNLMTRAQDAAAHVHGPMLVAYGGKDQLVPARATAAAWATLPETVRRGFYPAGFHLLMRDRTRAAVTGDVMSWILSPDRPLPSGGDSAAASWMAGQEWSGTVPSWLPASLDGLAGGPP